MLKIIAGKLRIGRKYNFSTDIYRQTAVKRTYFMDYFKVLQKEQQNNKIM